MALIEATWQKGTPEEVSQALRLFSTKELAVLRDHYIDRARLQCEVGSNAGPLLSVSINLTEAEMAINAAMRLDVELMARRDPTP